MSQTIFFIVNPNANSGKTKVNWELNILPQIQKMFLHAAWVFTEKPKDASYYAYYSKACGYDTVVAVGGDGTVNEVVNGLLGNPLVQLKNISSNIHGHSLPANKNYNCTPTLACLPMGTGCDFIKSLCIYNNIYQVLSIIKSNYKIICDVGLIKYKAYENEEKIRYFVNIGGAGANGEVVKRVNQSKKRFGKSGTFWVAAIQTLLKNNSFHVSISFDDEDPFEIDLRVLFICNGGYCGGGMLISPNAKLSDGYFRIVQIKKMNKIKSIYLSKRLYSGDFKGLEKDIHLRAAKIVKIFPLQNSNIPVECDGEQPCYAPAIFSIVPSAISIISDKYE